MSLLNTPYMATPYPAVLGGTKDSYNFYQLQLQIGIECSFGMLHRWAILRSAILMNVTTQKTVALVMALAKLHNYCIDADNRTYDLTSTANDEWHTEVNGAVPLVAPGDSWQDLISEQLLDDGNHFDDLGGTAGTLVDSTCSVAITTSANKQTDGVAIPRDRLHAYSIASIGVTRPTP